MNLFYHGLDRIWSQKFDKNLIDDCKDMNCEFRIQLITFG